MAKREIYVETNIKAPIEKVWEYTQNPALHEQWDIRFSSITYKPKVDNEPQKFTYTRSIAFGLKISGWGKSVGEHQKADGTKSSSLHFGTKQKLSPIKEGRGYWQYIPSKNVDETIFLTSYHYTANFGVIGSLFDRMIFKPLMGWGTALSFDVLKRWLEKNELPKSQYLRFFLTYGLAIFFAFIWIYHGLFPKIIAMHPEELNMTGFLFPLELKQLKGLIIGIGILEMIFGFLWLFYKNKRHLFILQCFLFPLLMTSAIIVDGNNALHPFSPVTFNIALIVLSVIGISVSKDVPTAKNCLRKRHAHDGSINF